MKLPKLLTTSPNSLKIFVALLFVALPLLGFYFGVKYQEWVYRRLQQEKDSKMGEDESTRDVWEEVSQAELEVVSIYTPPSCPSSKVELERGRSELEGVTRLPFFDLPKGIHLDQIYDKWAFPRFFRLGETYFTFYAQRNMQFAIDSRAKRAGVLYGSEDGTDWKWKILVEIKNRNGARNNPLYLWKEKDTLLLLIADDWGAGSGEGFAKLLASRDGGRSWEIQKCFYAEAGAFFFSESQSFTEAYGKYRETGFGKKHNYEYLLNPKTGECECSPRQPGTCHAGEACQNFQLLVINPIDFSALK